MKWRWAESVCILWANPVMYMDSSGYEKKCEISSESSSFSGLPVDERNGAEPPYNTVSALMLINVKPAAKQRAVPKSKRITNNILVRQINRFIE